MLDWAVIMVVNQKTQTIQLFIKNEVVRRDIKSKFISSRK